MFILPAPLSPCASHLDSCSAAAKEIIVIVRANDLIAENENEHDCSEGAPYFGQVKVELLLKKPCDKRVRVPLDTGLIVDVLRMPHNGVIGKIRLLRDLFPDESTHIPFCDSAFSTG